MNERPRFWRWYRTLPICAMALTAFVCFGLAGLPTRLSRRLLFPVRHREAILASSERHGVDPLLVCAVIKCESNWNAAAVSDAGAVGLMQVMPATSAELAAFGLVDAGAYDAANLSDPATNIEYGCAYLAQLQGRLSTTDEVVAAYNAGPAAVERWLEGGGQLADVISFPETALYLRKVNEAYERYQQLYTPVLSER